MGEDTQNDDMWLVQGAGPTWTICGPAGLGNRAGPGYVGRLNSAMLGSKLGFAVVVQPVSS